MFSHARFFICSAFFTLICFTSKAQTYAPPVGTSGTSAIFKDSSAFVNWASSCAVNRGYQDVSNPSFGLASAGESSMVIGPPDEGILSLGDGGTAICTFPFPVTNGAGPDFAVFENGFDNTFLELAFVEVSSDGINFFRFPAHSLTDTVTQTWSFGPTDATKINNFAGKYKGGYGTPFDLQDLANTSGLNINAVTDVKVVDVVGSINTLYATRDSHNNKVNDPWPTAYPSSGFDLDAIGVIHESRVAGIYKNAGDAFVRVYPNPASKNEQIKISASSGIVSVEVLDFSGKALLLSNAAEIDTEQFSPGIYLLKITTPNGISIKKIQIQ